MSLQTTARIGLWVVVALVLAGCATAPSPTVTPGSSTPTPPQEAIEAPEVVPTVDTTQHSVPLDEIYFDTFRAVNRAVPLSDASPELIERLRDAIPPIHDPKYEEASEAGWLADDDGVLGYAAGDEAWAYPIRVLNFHEIVNDTLAGEPVLISYCPLCFSGIVYDRRLGDRTLTFGNTSALYESDMVMLDYGTGSYWWQVAGEAIVGPLTGDRLTALPSTTTTWDEWRQIHPETLVLSRDTGYDRNYARNPFAGFAARLNDGAFAFPVTEAAKDPRLQPGAKVLSVRVGDEGRAYPLEKLGRAAVMDTVGGQEIVVFVEPGGPSGAAFEPTAGGRNLTFQVGDGAFVDEETKSTWDLAGRATDGPLQGEELPPVPSKTSFWYAIVAAEPEVSVYGESE